MMQPLFSLSAIHRSIRQRQILPRDFTLSLRYPLDDDLSLNLHNFIRKRPENVKKNTLQLDYFILDIYHNYQTP